ncbi:MAG: MAPEG family protein [Pseudomonadota bacterium]
MFTALYASILAGLICKLSLNVIKARRSNKVLYADGDCKELIIARTAQSNAVQYCPMAVLLLLLLELNSGHYLLVNAIGILFVIGRVIHARGILSESRKGRVLGMQITIYSFFALIISNISYLLYIKLVLKQ